MKKIDTLIDVWVGIGVVYVLLIISDEKNIHTHFFSYRPIRIIVSFLN